MNYEEAISKLKDNHPDLADIKFDIDNGELGYIIQNFNREPLDIMALQTELNKILGQNVYRARYTCYKEVYARNEDEAMRFLEQEKNTTALMMDILLCVNEKIFR